MEKQVYKYLPNGAPSGLSLNLYQIQSAQATKGSGLLGRDIYSLDILRENVLRVFPKYRSVPDFDVIGFIQEHYDAESVLRMIMTEIMEGLSNLICSLCEGSEKSRQCNINLFASDWAFWKGCEYIVLDGRLLFGKMGKLLCAEISHNLLRNGHNIQVLPLSDFTDVKTPSLLGCASGRDSVSEMQYVFDFGNSAVKRGCAKLENHKIVVHELLPVFHPNFERLEDTINSAAYLDDFILNIILQTIDEFQGSCADSFTINMCIANNILDHRIADRGSYRTLRLLNSEYTQHLLQRLSAALCAPVSLSIYNDAEAVGRIFSSFSPNTAIITLGTYMGIAYPPRTD